MDPLFCAQIMCVFMPEGIYIFGAAFLFPAEVR